MTCSSLVNITHSSAGAPKVVSYNGQTTTSVTLVLTEGDTVMVEVNVSGFPLPVLNVFRASGDTNVMPAVSTSLSTININNINRADAGAYSFQYINFVGILLLGLNLVVQCKFL